MDIKASSKNPTTGSLIKKNTISGGRDIETVNGAIHHRKETTGQLPELNRGRIPRKSEPTRITRSFSYSGTGKNEHNNLTSRTKNLLMRQREITDLYSLDSSTKIKRKNDKSNFESKKSSLLPPINVSNIPENTNSVKLTDKYYRRWKTHKSRKRDMKIEEEIKDKEINKPASLLNVSSSPEFQQVFKDLVINEDGNG